MEIALLLFSLSATSSSMVPEVVIVPERILNFTNQPSPEVRVDTVENAELYRYMPPELVRILLKLSRDRVFFVWTVGSPLP